MALVSTKRVERSINPGGKRCLTFPTVSSATQSLILTRDSSGAPAKSETIIPAP